MDKNIIEKQLQKNKLVNASIWKRDGDKVNVPKNATIDFSKSSWKCNSGFIKRHQAALKFQRMLLQMEIVGDVIGAIRRLVLSAVKESRFLKMLLQMEIVGNVILVIKKVVIVV